VRLCHTAADGTLWFGTFGGLARYDPETERPREPPRVEIAEVRVRGVPLAIPELGAAQVAGVVLAPDQGSLQIDYLGVAVGLGGSLRYQHRFTGQGRDWTAPTRQRTVHFPRLAPGRYEFEVRAITDDGLTSPVPATVSFRLLPPFWRRPWFLIATILAATALARIGFRARVRQLLAVERVRTRIASDLHDEVGAGLTRISFLGELARHRVESAPAAAGAMLEEIGTEARELAEATSDIVWAVDPRKDDLGSLVLRLRRFAADLLASQGTELVFEAPPDAAAMALAPEVRRVLYLVLKEAIHNAAKHAGARSVAVRIVARGHEVLAEVRDDGRGFDASQEAAAEEAGRRGLVGMRERTAAVGGALVVESAPGGTALALRLPLRGASRTWRARH
jgi:signal transduction histidine kinase